VAKNAQGLLADRIKAIEDNLAVRAYATPLTAVLGEARTAPALSPVAEPAPAASPSGRELTVASSGPSSPDGLRRGDLASAAKSVALVAVLFATGGMLCVSGCNSPLAVSVAADATGGALQGLAQQGTIDLVKAEPEAAAIMATVAADVAAASTNSLPAAASLNATLGLGTVAGLSPAAAKLVAQIDAGYTALYAKVQASPGAQQILAAALAGVAAGINQGLK
jgi:hypothetical protein